MSLSRLAVVLVFGTGLLWPTGGVRAQLMPDRTLGSESSQVIPDRINGLEGDRLTGGGRRGSSLFHSFSEFNVAEGRGAYFESPDGVVNIFSRVTGSNPSQILGTLGVVGSANLFFLNPNGVSFGPKARLDLRGSFLATTAEAIAFDTGVLFSARQPQAPLLSVTMPVGLHFRDRPGAIVNQSQATRNVLNQSVTVGLEVPSGQSLSLVGGDVILSGDLTSSSGQIHLGSVAGPGLVSLASSPGGPSVSPSFDYAAAPSRGAIDLTGTATVNTSGPGGGAIQVQAGRLTLRDRATFNATTLGNQAGRDLAITVDQLQVLDGAYLTTATAGPGPGGNLTIRARDSMELRGLGFADLVINNYQPIAQGNLSKVAQYRQGLFTGTVGPGAAGNLRLDTPRLMLSAGASLLGISVGSGTGSNMTLNVSDSLEIEGSQIGATVFSRGNGGTLEINTGSLTVRNGGLIAAATFGSGNGGKITINARDAILLADRNPLSPFATGIVTNSVLGTGQTGGIDITTTRLRLERGASIDSASGARIGTQLLPGGPAGNITIRARDRIDLIALPSQTTPTLINAGTTGTAPSGDLRLETGFLRVENAGLGSGTLGAARAGNVFITARDGIEVLGAYGNGAFPASIAVSSGDAFYAQVVGDTQRFTGAGGNLTVQTPQLRVSDGAKITVEGFGPGKAGNLTILADRLWLDRQGRIDGTATSGGGANLAITANEIQLRRASRISTNAGLSDGGNINLASQFLVAFPNQNSDITASARTAAGGKITIAVPNLFGFDTLNRQQARDRLNLTDAQFAALSRDPASLLPSNDIAAISQAAAPDLQGSVLFRTSGVNPAQGLVELPGAIVDSAQLMADNSCTRGQGSQFTLTGRGGVPPQPADALSRETLPPAWVEASPTVAQPTASQPTAAQPTAAAAWAQALPSPVGAAFADPTSPLPGSILLGNPNTITPAQGWITTETGQVTLVSYNANGITSGRNSRPSGPCQPR